MLTQRLFTALIAVAAILGSCLLLTAQDAADPFSASAAQPALARTIRALPNNSNSNLRSWRMATVGQQDKFAQEVAVASNALQTADSDESKATAKSDLRKALVADYENKMDRYDEHLEQLEKELEEMRERLSRRRAAKEEMVDLKLKEIVANADGLGWPTGPAAQRIGLFNEFPSTTAQRFPAAVQQIQSPTHFLARPAVPKAPTTKRE